MYISKAQFGAITMKRHGNELSRRQEHAIEFFEKYPGWHSFSTTDGITKGIIKSLEKRRLLEVNEHDQARSIV